MTSDFQSAIASGGAVGYLESLLEPREKSCYNEPMNEVAEKLSSLALPSETDDTVWNGMTRDEQLKVYQDLANHPDTTTPSDATVAEIVERTRQRRATQAEDDRKL